MNTLVLRCMTREAADRKWKSEEEVDSEMKNEEEINFIIFKRIIQFESHFEIV